MIKLHMIDIINKTYSEKLLNEQSKLGYSLTNVKLGFLFFFRKKENNTDEEYKILPIKKPSLFSNIKKEELLDLLKKANDLGYEKVFNNSYYAILKKDKNTESKEIYNLEDERDVINSVNKINKINHLLNIITFSLLLLLNLRSLLISIDSENINGSSVIFLSIVILTSFMVIISAVELFLIYKFKKKNKNLNERIKYFNSKKINLFNDFILKVFKPLAIIILLSALTIVFFNAKSLTQTIIIFASMILAIIISFSLAMFLSKKISNNSKYLNNKKMVFVVLLLMFSLFIITFVTTMMIFYNP